MINYWANQNGKKRKVNDNSFVRYARTEDYISYVIIRHCMHRFMEQLGSYISIAFMSAIYCTVGFAMIKRVEATALEKIFG